ncbi:hypothetical protein [Flavobacterium sp.]|uniref:hypothetical protein n=1 Tax=Flavobacterium sp. TaxID=239 RepID=UPI0039E2EAEE
MEKLNLTLTLMIPDVSLLLVYKDNWNKIKIMRKVIAELLRNGYFKEIQSTGKAEFENSNLEDCAIISLKLSGGSFKKSELRNPRLIFAKALDNVKNIMRFDSSVLSESQHTSYIEIALKMLDAKEKPNTGAQVA